MVDRQDVEANIRWSLRENNEKRGDFVGVDSVFCSDFREFRAGAEQFVTAAAYLSRDDDSGLDRHDQLSTSQRGHEHRLSGIAAAAVRERARKGHRESGAHPD